MNQIIFGSQEKKEAFQTKKKTSLHPYTILLYISSILLLTFLLFFLIVRYRNQEKENYSEVLLGKYHVSTLYAKPQNETSSSLVFVPKESDSPFVIGIIQIDSIKLNYPILSQSNEKLLTISPCRFAGPMPNEIRKFMYCWT